MSFRLPTRAIILALAVALLAVVAAGCGRDDDSSTGASAGSDTTGEQLSGTVIADGSSTVGPLTTAAAEAYREVQPDVNVEVGISGTGGGFERFCNGETDLSDASRPIKEDEEAPLCADAGIEYTDFQVAVDALTVVVNKENDWIDCITDGAAREDLGPGRGGQDHQLEPGRPELPRPGADALRSRHRLGHVRLLHRRDQR